ncbi:MAG: sulfatase [Puniceicoccaceae bacterium]
MKLLTGLIIWFVASTAMATDRPNVLFIMTDDLNCNIGAYGHPLVRTPHIDRLAEEGLLFENAFCNFPLCGPSRASFMTGLYPDQNGVTRLRRMFRRYVPDAVTLSQHFMNNGYAVARVGKIYHYDNPGGIGTNGHDDPLSWEERINPRGRDKEEQHLIEVIRGISTDKIGGTLSWMAAGGDDLEQTDGMVATESIALMREYTAQGRPFFLAVGFYKPHTPFVAPRKYFDLYDPEEIEIPRVPDGYFNTLPAPAVKTLTVKKAQLDLPEATQREVIHAYYATISFLDAQVGRLITALEELELKDHTIVLFSSDHGYHMGEHDHFQKQTLFEDADRVPLILSVPGMASAGKRTPAIVEMIDFYRTLTELAGLEQPPSYIQGKSMVSVLNDPEKQTRESALTQHYEGYTIRTKRYRYTYWPDANGLNAELYDRLNDPAEMVNLAGHANYEDVQMQLHALWKQRVEEAKAIPDGLEFIPPGPEDNGIGSAEALRLFKEGKL